MSTITIPAGYEPLFSYISSLGIAITEKQAAQLEAYQNGILVWNQKVNITAITDRSGFLYRHYIDSLSLLAVRQLQAGEEILDVGTGGGFPGIPLAILMPQVEFFLLDSLAKRLKIIDGLCKECEIGNVHLLHGRAEDYGRDPLYRSRFSVCVSRAVAPYAVLAEYCLPFLKVGGSFYSFKSAGAEKEVREAKKALLLLKGEIKAVYGPGELHLSDFSSLSAHLLIEARKIKETPTHYPRQAGTPSKKPLI